MLVFSPALRQRNVLRFWRESTRDTKNVCDTVVAHFLGCPTDRFRAHFTPKSGHIALSPCLVCGWVVVIDSAGVIFSLEMGQTKIRCGAEGCCTVAST